MSSNVPVLNDGETKLLASAWHCMKKAPEVDYQKLATIMGHTNHKSTANALARILKKLEVFKTSDEDGPPNATQNTAAAPVEKKGTKRKTEQAVKNEPASDNESVQEEPKSKKRATAKGKAPIKKVKKDDNSEEDALSTRFTPINDQSKSDTPAVGRASRSRSASQAAPAKGAKAKGKNTKVAKGKGGKKGTPGSDKADEENQYVV